MANIAEGFERGRPGEFSRFLSIAKGSCGEVKSHLYAALDRGAITKDQFEGLSVPAQRTLNIIGALNRAVRKRYQNRNP